MRHIASIICCLFFVIGVNAQTSHQLLRKGNKDYDKQEFSKAEEKYRKALEVEPTEKSSYNLANSVYQQERYKEAIKHYQATIQNTEKDDVKARSYYNLGNAHLKNNQLKEAVEAYKQSLRLNSKDMDTKHNLSMAIRQMRQQQQKQQNKNQQSQQQQQQKKDQKKESQNGQQDQQQQQQQSQDQQKQQQQQQEQEGQEINRDEAKKLLQIMNEEEKKVQEKIRRGKGKRRSSEKDW